MQRNLSLTLAHGTLIGQLAMVDWPRGLILLARVQHSQLDVATAEAFGHQGFAVLRMELLTHQEMQFLDASGNVPRLTHRLLDVLDLIRIDGDMQPLPLVIHAQGDTTPAALRAAAQRDTQVKALGCHGGLLDRAGLQALELLAAPLLLQLDAHDELGRAAWERARPHLAGPHQLAIVAPGADAVTAAAQWFRHVL